MGCKHSTEAAVSQQQPPKKPVTGVGQSERVASRAAKLRAKKVESSDGSSLRGSKREAGGQQENNNKQPPKLDADGHLMPEEVVRRSTSSITSKTLELGTEEHPVLVEYAHWTQRGYYPDDPHKENQDDFSVTPKFAGGERDAMFAVYDGHGKRGHECARFAKKKLPTIVAKHIRQARVKKYQDAIKREQGSVKGAKLFDPENWPVLDPEEYKSCCKKGFLVTNKQMHKDPKVEDNISGTTAISVSFHETLLTICNVGDSRAVLGHQVEFPVKSSGRSLKTPEEEKEEIGDQQEDGEHEQGQDKSTSLARKEFPKPESLLAIPLSRDQTPYRKDERERVKKRGAAIMSIDQMEGKEEMHENWGDMVLGEDVDIHGDPPRVWVNGKDYPGTAFTRSIGDSMAESIGVNAEPEMLARHVTSNDHLLVIASDGIFEFLTNQEVIDLCAKCESPIIACEKLVKEAYKQWMIYENRTDDITVIVCFLSVQNDPPSDSTGEANGEKAGVGTTEDLVELAKSVYGNKPVRKAPRSAADNLSSPFTTINTTTNAGADNATKAGAENAESSSQPLAKDNNQPQKSFLEVVTSSLFQKEQQDGETQKLGSEGTDPAAEA